MERKSTNANDVTPLSRVGKDHRFRENKATYTATEVACGWEGAVIKKANQAFGQER